MVAVPPVGAKVPRCDLQFGRICPAKYTMHRTVIPRAVQLFCPKHPFQIVGLVAALSFVVVRLYNADPFLPRNNAVYLC